MRTRYLSLTVLALSLGGCSSMPECNDPSAGGFFGGVCGLASGNYDKRVEEREQNLAALKQMRTSEQTVQAHLQTEKQSVSKQMLALQQQAQQIDGEAAELQKQIAALQTKNSKSQGQKAALQKRVQQFRQQLATQKTQLDQTQASDAEIQRYQAEEKRLMKELDKLKSEMYTL